MRGLFTKIFLGFWIAQSLTFAISTMLILQHHFVRPNELADVLNATIPITGASAVAAWEANGCDGLRRYAESLHQTMYLAQPPSHVLCEATPPASAADLLRTADTSPGVHTSLGGNDLLWAAAISSPGKNAHYLFLLSRPHPSNTLRLHDLLHFAFPQLPVAVVVCGVTTFILVLLLIRPIGKLRVAAQKLAGGDLSARVVSADTRLVGGDEIQGLVQDFNQMAERLEHLVGAQKMLLRDVSHELRSPLARLSVALELANEEAPPAMAGHLQRIEREAGRLNSLIGQLLRLSSMESGNAFAQTEAFSLSGLVDDLLPDAEFEAQQRACTIRVVERCDCLVHGNPELIYRAVENVVRNAIRYTRQSSEVELSLHCDERAGVRMVTLEVADRGPGLPETELENVFRPFYRVDDSRQTDTGGFGVGLAIAERVLRLHNGEVNARNRSEGGLAVSLRLPCDK